MQKLLATTSQMQVCFNPKKSATVVFSGYLIGDCSKLVVQGEIIPPEHEYKYLGIQLCDSSNYLKKQEEIWMRKFKRALHQMHAQLLWSSNKFEMSKTYWKVVAVPTLTYGNAVTVMTAKTSTESEKTQRCAARWALGIPGWRVANEFLEAELHWSSFEAREAKSKLKYHARISAMPETRWPRAILEMIKIQKFDTKTCSKIEELKSRYDCDTLQIEYNEQGKALLGIYYRQLDERIKARQEIDWVNGMADKSLLEMYRCHKESRTSAVHIYDNSRGSALLALARAGPSLRGCLSPTSPPTQNRLAIDVASTQKHWST